ncbi:MAG: autotransporter outer membrane beta-barrel domain-containing protein [Phascolarctobacterium sp.]|nr:autotransporter outer membrane beta-barrel domain-containing protein [Phascolarctobacterium sp.]
MSKKTFKRSLALGALMAFVITGSAWASDGHLGWDYVSDNDCYRPANQNNDAVLEHYTLTEVKNFCGYGKVTIGEGFIIGDSVGGNFNQLGDVMIVGNLEGDGVVDINGCVLKSGSVMGSFAGTGNINLSGNTELEDVTLSGGLNGGVLNINGWNGEISQVAFFNTININEGSSVKFGFVEGENSDFPQPECTVNVKGATWNVDEDNTVVSAYFDATSTLKIDGATFEKNTGVYALNGNKKGSLTVAEGAKIVINGGEVDGVYNVAKDFANNQGANWALQADNALWYVDWTDLDKDANTLQGTIKAKSAQQMVETGVATNENKEILVEIAGSTIEENVNPTVDAIKELTSVESNLTSDQQQKAIAAVLQVGEAGGFTGNVVSVSKQVNGSVGARNSFSGPKHGGPRHRGGHGPSVTEEANGSAIWAQYVHGKDKVDGIDMGGVENAYESQFNGVVLGTDFKQVGSYASGIAFNYGEGDSHSKKNVVQSDSEFDFWGVSYYGAVKKQDTNFIFDIGYSESDSDVEQKSGANTITANPEASTWTAGVKVEKLIDKGAVQIVPYAGLRFMTIDTAEYEAKGGTTSEATYYSTERQNIWLVPVGVSLSQENVYDSGWIVTPKADLSYTWAMGDTDSSMTVNMPGVGYYDLGYTVMDDGSFMATVGLDAQKEDWTFGVAYSYQKGDSARSDRWYVNARYSF